MLLIDREALAERRERAAGPLAPLAASLAAELDRAFPGTDIFIPVEKAKLTRRGGRCERDGTPLDFDPREPRRHRCARCGAVFDDETHYRWWVMSYQLWLAERAVHASVLWALLGADRHRQLAEQILAGLARQYLSYPNVDNVLGPTRPFFSTYLESIWLLQLVVALDFLEDGAGRSALGEQVRERLIEPSVGLIASYNEGASNRQVWNSAALAAASRLLDNPSHFEDAVHGPGGLIAHLEHGLLSDGTWYEGENYHLFAHRGLWYLVTIAEQAGVALPPRLMARFMEGFVTPFLTALPDFTFPARRDSQYGVSLRQWRLAESCELGVGRRPSDARLQSALGELYRADAPPGDSARWRSTAEAERNVPGVRLTRSDLGWKSLLFACPTLPSGAMRAPESALFEGQGFALFRRQGGRVYVAMDYGHSGGGHGHPDRLNLWLVDGDHRVLEDFGTGSYVESTLHWYRSTLAHNAPLVDGRSQLATHGVLLAWAESGDAGWVDATARVAPGVDVRRCVVVMPEYVIERVEWVAPTVVTVDLPYHVDAVVDGVREWTAATPEGGAAPEDGFVFLGKTERAQGTPTVSLRHETVQGWILSDTPHEWWRGVAPGAPGAGSARFQFVRATRASGSVWSVWSWTSRVRAATQEGEAVLVLLEDGTRERHGRDGDGWRIDVTSGSGWTGRVLKGSRATRLPDVSSLDGVSSIDAHLAIPRLSAAPAAPGELTRASAAASSGAPLRFRMSRRHYRRSEASWTESGSPEALVSLGATRDELFIEVSVRKHELAFAPERAENALDNELADTNSDGIQLYIRGVPVAGRGVPHHSWIVVPVAGSTRVRITPRIAEGGDALLTGEWRPTPQGYQVLLRVGRKAVGAAGRVPVSLDVIVNETSLDRERRRGQLVLSGAPGEWTYLRGDRQDPTRYLWFRLADE
jgi:hypothetical protein